MKKINRNIDEVINVIVVLLWSSLGSTIHTIVVGSTTRVEAGLILGAGFAIHGLMKILSSKGN